MGIKYVTQILNGKVVLSDQIASMHYSTEEELAILVTDLIAKGYAFTDEPSGWTPAAIVQRLKDKELITQSFIAITWSGPNVYRTFEVE